MQDVELVDVTDRPRAPGRPRTWLPPAPPEDPPAARPPRPAHRRRWVALVVVLGLVVAGALVGRAAAPDAPVVVAPGMLAPLDGPPWARWRVPVARSADVLAASGALVVSGVRDRRFAVAAYDEDSGERLWTRDLGPVAGTRPLTGCPHAGSDVGPVVLCVVEPPVVPGGGGLGTVPFPAPDERWAQVSALDATTGDVLGRWTVAGRLAAVERIGDDLVVLRVGADGHARVGRYAGADGHRLWWYRGASPLRLREGIVSGSELRVNDAFVLLQGWSATVLDATDGEELTASPRGSFVVGSLSRDVFGTWSSGDGGVVRDRTGRALFTSRALFPAVTASDGDPPDVLVMDEGGTLSARSLPGGTELWRHDTYRAVRLQAGGHLLLLGVDGYQVVAARTGTVEWESPSRVLMWWAPLTDGTLVLGAGRSGTGTPTMEARRLADGGLEWVLPIEQGVRSVTAVGGHLVLRNRDELILLT
ncbi:PQQ-binding-like beta-propeller repeat protein [Cellulomonas sp. ACRRI]|uniref:outer membrane protein assembly factor BamB family protein n=1 Tax=Cellulomonas sp. ACRRI TaxID=2918188 RepID=UPI001EF382F8|nr:PQQ-binding-like beta-propeller repeat protein [Cellulomonas sp. ACRRI]MCG7285902.1 PQQ-binding-like beta-propeller repeat protein [Cellulomonas sp. ACRRI]